MYEMNEIAKLACGKCKDAVRHLRERQDESRNDMNSTHSKYSVNTHYDFIPTKMYGHCKNKPPAHASRWCFGVLVFRALGWILHLYVVSCNERGTRVLSM